MKRRQFLQSIAASAGAPLMPAGLLGTPEISPALYSRAVSYVAGDECFAPNHLLKTLGLNGETGQAVLSQLRLDGLVGEMGNTGLMFSKTHYAKQAKIAAAALHDAYASQSGGNHADILQNAQQKFRDLAARVQDVLEPVDAEPSKTEMIDTNPIDEVEAVPMVNEGASV